MKRTRMPPGKPIARKTPVKRANKTHRAENFARAYGGADRVDWVSRQPCVVCGFGPSENAHTKTDGAGRKADARWVVPLCHPCHAELHYCGIKTFEEQTGIDLDAEAAKTEAAYIAHQNLNPRTP